MVAVQERLGDLQSGELGGAGVMRIIQQAAGAVLGAGNAFNFGGDVGVGDAEAFKLAAGFVAEDAGQQSHGCVDHHSGGKFSS